MTARLAFARDALLRPFGQIVFSRDPWVGLLVLLAVGTFPKLALASLGAVLVAGLVTWAFGFGTHAVREGGYACTAVLTTLATGVFDPGGGNVIALVVFGAAVAVLLSASFESVFSAVALPTHSLPFIASAWVVHLAARSLAAPRAALDLMQPWTWLPHAAMASGWWDVPASLVFLHGAVAGGLLIAAIAMHSRIALILAGVGALAAGFMRFWLRSGQPWDAVDLTASFNGILTAIAIGGVWFVPQASSIALGFGASLVAVLLTYALFPALGVASLPVLSAPFVITTHLLLTAARRRLHNRNPRSAVPDERPEDILGRHLVWMRRYGDAAWLPFRLPFRGTWFVSQGYDGEHTHKGLWRHGLDFEGRTKDGKSHERTGAQLRDYVCYGLPVVAAGAGTVAKIVDGVKDNKPGEMNTDDNWGNVVIIAHGSGLYTVYAHLQARSLRVKPGDVVEAGAEIARCGNSGRSPTPHLHFQVQQSATLGAPTVPADFGDVVIVDDDGHKLENLVIPEEGQMLRPVVRDNAMARALAFPPTEKYLLALRGSDRTEQIKATVDLWGRRFLESDRARLYFQPYDAGLVFVDFRGDPDSLLRFVFMSLSRLPLDQSARLSWQDSLSKRLLLSGVRRGAADLLAVVAPSFGSVDMDYELERGEGNIVVNGKSDHWSTTAHVSLGGHAHLFEVQHRGERQIVEMTKYDDQENQPSEASS